MSLNQCGMAGDNGPVPVDRVPSAYQRSLGNISHSLHHSASANLLPFGFKPPDFVHWNMSPSAAACSPYSPNCSRVLPGDRRLFDCRPLPSCGDESTGSHEVLSKDGSLDGAVDSHGNGFTVGQLGHHTQSQPSHALSQTNADAAEDPNKKKRDRFKGMTEDEVLMRMLPDHLVPNLDIVIIGINHGLTAAYVGHHYAGPGNHFWKCLYMSGLIPEPMNCYDDYRLLNYGIGFTNIVARCTKGSADLTRKELKEGIEILTAKVQKYKPKIAVFNGKGIYEIFCGNKNFYIGKQPDPFPGTANTTVFVMPSSSARCSQLPRAVDKVPFYVALRKLRDFRCGELAHLDESEVTFPDLELKVEPRKDRLDRQLKQQQEAAAVAAMSHSIDRKRRFDGEPDFDSMFPAVRHAYPSFPSNGFAGTGNSPSWNPAALTSRWPGMPPIGLQNSSVTTGGSSLVQRLTQMPTVDSMFGSVPPLLKSEDASLAVCSSVGAAAAAAGFSSTGYGHLDHHSAGNRSSSSGYWPPASSHHYGNAAAAAAFTNYPYNLSSLYGAAAGSGFPPTADGQYGATSARISGSGSSFSYQDGTTGTADFQALSSGYPANLHAAAAAAAVYDTSPFLLSHGMSTGHLAGAAASWPAAQQYMSSRSSAVPSTAYVDAFGRDGLDGMSSASIGGGF